MARRRVPAAPAGCPCGLPAAYDACCGRFHRGEAAAPTAELLMRSRFSAFARGETAYLLSTWHPTTRPPRLVLDGTRWTRLEVLGSTGGGLLETEGTVRFRAHHDGGVLEEDSRFVRAAGRWAYLGPSA